MGLLLLASVYVSAQNSTPDYTQWYVGVSAGASVFDNEEPIPNVIGLQGAYFFNQKYGAGLVARKCNVFQTINSAKRTFFTEEQLFVGASFFAHWGRSNSKLYFPTRIGLGINQSERFNSNTQRFWNETLVGAHGSVGISIRPSKLISFGVNAEFASSFEWMDSVEFLGLNLGVSFHF